MYGRKYPRELHEISSSPMLLLCLIKAANEWAARGPKQLLLRFNFTRVSFTSKAWLRDSTPCNDVMRTLRQTETESCAALTKPRLSSPHLLSDSDASSS